jgi:hypothetical protein
MYIYRPVFILRMAFTTYRSDNQITIKIYINSTIVPFNKFDNILLVKI